MSGSDQSFVDYVRITVKAGDGGDGCMSFRREKHVPHGGPDGGDGGKGGDVWLVADPHLTTLLDLKFNPYVVAKRGKHGKGKNMSGKSGEDQFIYVPLGTHVSSDDGPLGDLTEPGSRFLAAAGGLGGAGNQHYPTSTNQAPRKHKEGHPGQQRRLTLELKIIADAGLVGLPNAGKSTLLKSLTHATPKIAPYPFTTIHPNLGMMEISGFRSVTLADIPGLIEGASRGVGLGDRFLRHIERTAVLVHVVAPDPSYTEAERDDQDESEEAEIAAQVSLDAYHLVRRELEAYSAEILKKPEIVVISKCELLSEKAREIFVAAFKREGIEALPISAHEGINLERLRSEIESRLEASGRLAKDSSPTLPASSAVAVGCVPS